MFGDAYALMFNAEREFERNRERYEFLRWGKSSFDNFRVVPPATGIVHQVNLEYLAKVVYSKTEDGVTVAFPDTLVGTDSHTTMINGLGVLGWGVGGIEAEAVMLGQPMYFLMPEVIGFKLTGQLPEGATATDLVLTVTQMLRKRGVVEKFVEFYGPGLSSLALADRATIGNMAPEYGATCGFFPVDNETLRYMRTTGRPADLVDLVDRYTKEQGLFRTDETPDPLFTDTMELDLSTVEPSLAGPKRPQDRIALKEAKQAFAKALIEGYGKQPSTNGHVKVSVNGKDTELADGSVVIAAITSCTNTSNPSVMIGAGLVAKKAVEMGLDVPPYVKTSLAPGSKVVTRYLEQAGLNTYLDQLRFNLVGYGCTTCIGNSGPIDEGIAKAVKDNDLVVAAVLSGNRNFEGRVHPSTRANYLASPPLVVAYALAGRMDIDFQSDPIGSGKDGKPVYLKDIWPTQQEVAETLSKALTPEMFTTEYGNVFDGNETWNKIAIPEGALYKWDDNSTYIAEPPFFVDLTPTVPDIKDIKGARALAVLGDSVTTDHISPAGSISADGPAGKYLIGRGIKPADFNSFGSRRGHHEVMMRGTFGNIRLKNQMVPGVEGPYTSFQPSGEQMFIYDASMKYQKQGTPLVVLAGKEYGTGSSRDWAAKGAILLGVKVVISESFERIHRSNLVGMGVLPLIFKSGQNAASLGLDGRETFDISLSGLKPHSEVTVKATKADGKVVEFKTTARIDSAVELKYYQNGGILHAVLRDMLKN
jgi:aconitate hydratase